MKLKLSRILNINDCKTIPIFIKKLIYFDLQLYNLIEEPRFIKTSVRRIVWLNFVHWSFCCSPHVI